MALNCPFLTWGDILLQLCCCCVHTIWLHAQSVVRRPKVRHHSLAIYVLLRGITLLVRCGNKPDAPRLARRLLAPTRWRHGDTGLMCLCTSQLAYSWICKPQTLPPAFVHFLNKHGGKEMWFYRAARVRACAPVAAGMVPPIRPEHAKKLCCLAPDVPLKAVGPGWR